MRKTSFLALLVAVFLIAASPSEARDTRHMLSIQRALATADARAKLESDVQFVFGRAAGGEALRHLGTFTANRKTNAFNKSDTEACNWVFLSALIALQERARREGGNAVVNIRSYYKKNEVASETQFECGAGTMVAGVTLKGDVVSLE